MKPQELIEHFGNKTKAAAEIGVAENTIRLWVKSGNIPMIKQYAIQAITKNKLKADANG